MEQRKAEASYGIPDAELTPSLNWSAYSLRKLWNEAKNTTAPLTAAPVGARCGGRGRRGVG
jgi:hypothetical protein